MDNYLKYLYGNDELKIAFKYILENNSSWDNPYHNTNHLLDVFNNAMRMSTYYDFNKKDRTTLGISALFHDYRHTGGELTDDENIIIATNGVSKFIKEVLPEIDIDEVFNLIEITEFPHKRKPEITKEEIIIDSDLISIYQNPNWFNGIVVALAKESGNDIEKQIDIQIGFMENIKLNTEYAQKLQEENTTRIISELRFLKTMF